MSSVGSLCSTGVSRFLATMDPSDSRRNPTVVMSSHRGLEATPPSRRVSQVPRLIFPRALSTITPGGPMGAFARFFPIGGGLHHCLAGWPLSISVTRPNRVHLRYGSRVRSAGLRPFGLLRGPPAPLSAERAINRATTFQVARSARLILAHQTHADTHRQGVSRPLALEFAESAEVINLLSDSLRGGVKQNVPSAVGGKCLSAVDMGIA